MKRRALLCAFLLFASWSAQAVCYGDQKHAQSPLTFSPVPQLPLPILFARWAPVLEAVGKNTGQCFELIIKPTIPEFEKYLLKSKPALAYVNPYHAVMAYKANRYTPLLADGGIPLTGILVVRKDGSIHKLSDLRGQPVDFPAPNAFAASLLLRAHLQQLKIDIKPHYVRTHSNVYRGVILGEAAAGGGVNKTLEVEPEDIRQKLTVLYETPGYRSHPIIVSPSLPQAVKGQILEAFVALSQTDYGHELLAGVQLSQPVPVSYQKDYFPLEQLGLEKLVIQDE